MEISKLPQEYKDYISLKKQYLSKIRIFIKKKNKNKKINKKKPKCLNCNRNVGMLFKDNGIHFLAKCGDDKKPCDFSYDFNIPKYTRVSDRKEEVNQELNTILGQLKNMKLRIMYSQEVEKNDAKLFKNLKTNAIKLIKENKILRDSIPIYPNNIEDTGVVPDDFFERLEFYKQNKNKLQDYYLFERRPIIDICKSGFGNKEPLIIDHIEELNTTTLVSNLSLLTIQHD